MIFHFNIWVSLAQNFLGCAESARGVNILCMCTFHSNGVLFYHRSYVGPYYILHPFSFHETFDEVVI